MELCGLCGCSGGRNHIHIYGLLIDFAPFVCVQVAVKVIDLEEEDDEMEEIQRVRSNKLEHYQRTRPSLPLCLNMNTAFMCVLGL